jgi:TP901 family phage tail tape measure protein
VAFKPIEILINAKDNASSVFTSLQSKVVAVGAAVATYFGISAFVGVVKGAADFEQAMSRVKAATGASAEEMARLRKVAEDAGANTQFTSVEAAAALENLAKAGLNANDAIAALPAVMQLAAAGGTDLGQASEFITKAVMGMGLAFSDAGRVADVLALGANATNTSVTGLAQALSYAAPVANSLGLSLESTVAIIGKFADAGIDASRAGTALNSILSQFANPASSFRNELAAAGITTGNFEDALHQLAKAGPAGSKAINAVGQEAGPALRALLNQGMGALDDLTAKLKDAEGSAAATAKVMQDNLNGSLTGLSSAWQTVKNVLGTPVLPVIKDGVDQLSAALKSAVADGTVAKFGEAIATAFQTGIKWVREFLGTVDFAAVTTRLQDFATRTGEVFTQVGVFAKNAGNVVKLSYGVMSAGVNAVLTAIYSIGLAFTETAAFILNAGIKINEGLQKIAIGDAKQRIINETAQMREALGGLGAVSDAFSKKMRASFEDAKESAGLASEGFDGVTGTLRTASTATDEWAKTVAAANVELAKTAQVADGAAVATEKKAQADRSAKQASDEHGAAIAALRQDYADLIARGDLQGAAAKLQEINKALRDTAPAAKDAARAAADAAAQIEAAFGRLGVTSAADLKRQADAAQRDYDTIKRAGTSTAEDISNAFKVAAEKAIAANKGIAPSWVEAEAATRGYEVQVDAAGKSTLKLRDAVDAVGASSGRVAPGMQRDWGGVTSAINTTNQALQDYQRRMQQTYGRPGQGDKGLFERGRMSSNGQELAPGVQEVGSGGSQFRNKEGFTSDALGRAQTMGIWTRTAIIDYLTSAGLDELIATKLSEQFLDANGNVPYAAGDVQKKWAGKFGTLSEALGKMAEFYKFDDQGQAQAAAILEFEKTRRTTPQAAKQPAAATPAPQPAAPVTAVTLNFNGLRRTVNTDAAGASALQDLLRELQSGKAVF